jgi:cystathionine beta-lyase/cystathionine gamma-synthase
MKGDTTDLGFSTRAIHAGQEPDPTTGAVNVPIYATSTYAQEALGKHKGFEYARVQNPTRSALEANIASLEGGRSGHAFASGMAAISALMTMLRSGEHVVASDTVYGGTFRLLTQVLDRYGLTSSWVDTGDLAAIEAAMTTQTRMVYVETPTNPMMGITDLAGAAQIAHRHDALLVVDNTFASPYFQLQGVFPLYVVFACDTGSDFLQGKIKMGFYVWPKRSQDNIFQSQCALIKSLVD